MRKFLLTVLTSVSALTAGAQQVNYTVSGTVADATQKVYILDVLNRYNPIDSVVPGQGRFSFSGTQAQNALLAVGHKGGFVLLFFNDGTPLTVNLEALTLSGSPLNERLNGYDRELTAYGREISAVIDYARAHQSQLTEQQMDSLGQRYMTLSSEMTQRTLQVIKDNPDNLIPAAFVTDLASELDYEQLRELCNPERAYYHHPAMQRPRHLLENMEKRAIGKRFTDMTINDMEGQPHQLSEWIGKGKYVMIDFWASWCGPCRQEMPNVVRNYEKYHAAGFEIIGISFDQRDAPWKQAVRQMNMTWPQLSDLGGWQSAASGVYGINSIPASILFDGEGSIIATDLRGEQLGQKLSQLYGF